MSQLATPTRETATPGIEEDVCHLARGPGSKATACGAGVATNAHGGLRYEGQRVCPQHDREVCPTCRAIVATFQCSGEWEGA